MRSTRSRLVIAGALLVVSVAVASALLAASPPVSLTVRGFAIKRWPKEMAKQMRQQDYVVATIELSNASSRAITYWAWDRSNYVDCSVLTETSAGWKRPKQGFRCGTGLQRFSLAPGRSISFEADVERDKPCKVAVEFSDGRTPNRLWQRLPRWLSQRLPWGSGGHTAISATIDVRNPGPLPVEIAEPLSKPREATADLQREAKDGNADAQFKLAGRYWIGDEVDQSVNEALKWYESAAASGHVEAAYNLGSIYEYGLGVTANPTNAITWYRKAGERGHAAAQDRLQALASK